MDTVPPLLALGIGVRVSGTVVAVPQILGQWEGVRCWFPVRSGRGAAVIGAQPDLGGGRLCKVEVDLWQGVSQMPQRGASSRVQDQQSATTADPRANAMRRHVLLPAYVRPVDRSRPVRADPRLSQ